MKATRDRSSIRLAKTNVWILQIAIWVRSGLAYGRCVVVAVGRRFLRHRQPNDDDLCAISCALSHVGSFAVSGTASDNLVRLSRVSRFPNNLTLIGIAIIIGAGLYMVHR
ncbi:MAG: hypothetical protein ABJJ37_20670, partial [Roseibium sp.]